MTIEERFSERYKSGDTPWDIGQPDFNLIEVVTKHPVHSCKALEIGCGTGDNSIWLAQNNFQVTGTDTSDIAIRKAKEKSADANIKCDFILADFLRSKVEGTPFGFVFDRGCFHVFSSEDDRKKFAGNVAAHLEEDGLWLTIAGNADDHREGPGPPQRTAADIVLAVEPYFMILSLTSGHFGSNHPNPPRAWRCLMQKRRGRTDAAGSIANRPIHQT
ncbi:MAG: class I SAM-dependent methyltransferase [Deltaproteobacteria bacterium HGW-Deltaproteobacteria-13]|jgi:SAM-dependent methyltransferase|nr:MAG: class I SAM-dependent methyltransferase [Deltaproteobacteria bacterium HGW-Deltaproteobacteria-13]